VESCPGSQKQPLVSDVVLEMIMVVADDVVAPMRCTLEAERLIRVAVEPMRRSSGM
jgi:hypothetical protein